VRDTIMRDTAVRDTAVTEAAVRAIAVTIAQCCCRWSTKGQSPPLRICATSFPNCPQAIAFEGQLWLLSATATLAVTL
jgi:hypothetical protein